MRKRRPYGSAEWLSMVVYCKTCGEPALLSRRWWSRRSKGVSINKDAMINCVSGSVHKSMSRPLRVVFTIRPKASNRFLGEVHLASLSCTNSPSAYASMMFLFISSQLCVLLPLDNPSRSCPCHSLVVNI